MTGHQETAEDRVRRRPQLVPLLGMAVVLVLAAAAVALARIGSGGSSPQQVAAREASSTDRGGAFGPSVTGAGAGQPGVPAAPSSTPPGTVTPTSSSGGTAALPAATAVSTTRTPETPPAGSSAPAPSSTSLAGTSQLQGSVVFGPVCPVARFPPDPACAPRPGAAHIQLGRPDGTVAAQGDAGSDGHFALAVAPGTYTVIAGSLPPAPAVGRGCSATPALVTLAPGAVTNVEVSCDTGIR